MTLPFDDSVREVFHEARRRRVEAWTLRACIAAGLLLAVLLWRLAL